MGTRVSVAASLCLSVWLCCTGTAQDTETRPNIVLILTDDQRADTLQYMPQVQALLVAQGVTFSHAFVSSPLCCPSRASLFTGKIPSRHQVLDNTAPNGGAKPFVDGSTLATWLKDAGYQTGYFGKYLNQYSPSYLMPWPYLPPGWSQWKVMKHPAERHSNYVLVENGSEVAYGTGEANRATNVIMGQADQFIRSASRPFFAVVAPPAPHAPYEMSPADLALFKDHPSYRPPSVNEADVSDKPAYIRALPVLTDTQLTADDGDHRKYLAMLPSIDRGVQRLFTALTESGHLSNTIVIYTSDNGYLWGEHRLRKNKTCVYEPCIRIPLVIRSSVTTARVDERLVSLLDLPATIAHAAGVTPPWTQDGRTLDPLLKNEIVLWRSDLLIEWLGTVADNRPPFVAVRSETHIYAEYLETGEKELYDLGADPDQLQNHASNPAYAAVVTAMQARLAVLRGQ